jgi:cytochrome c556
LQSESVKLVAAAKSGNQDAFKTAFGATAGTCKTCHDDFRAK